MQVWGKGCNPIPDGSRGEVVKHRPQAPGGWTLTHLAWQVLPVGGSPRCPGLHSTKGGHCTRDRVFSQKDLRCSSLPSISTLFKENCPNCRPR